MWVVIILFMCRHCDTVICSPMLCECLLYFSYIVRRIHLYVAQCYVRGYYVYRMSSQACSCAQVTKILPLHSCNSGLCTSALSLRHTASCPRTVRAVCMMSQPSLIHSERLRHGAMFNGTYRSNYWLFVEYLNYERT